MKQILFIVIFLFLVSCASIRHEKYSTGDIYREVAVQVFNVADYASTDKILGDHPSLAVESNPLLGSNPSRNTLIGVAVGTGLIHGIVSHFLPARYRPYWQWPFIFIKAGVVANNYHIDFLLSEF